MTNEKYTPEGLPIITKDLSDNLWAYNQDLFWNNKENIKNPDRVANSIGNFISHLATTNITLLTYFHVYEEKIRSGESLIAVTRPDFAYRTGFFDTYMILQIEGRKIRSKVPDFQGIPEVTLETTLEFESKMKEWDTLEKFQKEYGCIIKQIIETNPVLYNHGANGLKHLRHLDSEHAHIEGSYTIIQLLREQHEIYQEEKVRN